MSNDHHRDHHHHDQHESSDDMTAILDLDGEVLCEYWSAALDWVAGQAAGTAGKRLLDLGAGTGTGALGLAERFPDAEVLAVDVVSLSLERLRDKARDRGLGGRVTAIEADLDGSWPGLGVLDLTWASMSLHHLADPGRVLRDVLDATSPGGLIAVAEFSQALRFLPDDLGFGRPGLEERLAERLGHAHAEAMPTLGTAWAPRLEEAGWDAGTERDFPVDLNPPAHPAAQRYASAWFERLSRGLTEVLDPGDREALAALLDPDGPHSLLRRADLHIRGTRTITIGRRGVAG
jgi:SAM-dependent methyltransferase